MPRQPRLLLGASALVLTVLAAAPALAEAVGVEEVTVTATRVETPVLAVPATVSVIGSQQIEDQLIRNIKDLVRFEPGVSVTRAPARFTVAGAATGRDNNAGFNIRGLEGNRVLIMIDGVRVPDGYAFGAQNMGRGDYVDLDLLKSVEIVRGPASALYGSDGLAGSVSYFTKDPSDVLRAGQTSGGGAKASYASADRSWTESLVGAARQGRWEAMVAYTRRDGHEQETQGTNDSANTDRTKANPETARSNAVLGKLVFRASDTQRLRLTLDHLDSDYDWTVLTAIAKPPLASTSATSLFAHDTARRDRVTVDHRYAPASGWLSQAQTSVYFQDSHTNQFGAETRAAAAARTRIGTFDNQVWGVASELRSQTRWFGLANTLVYGGDYSSTHQTGVRDGTVPPVGETFPTRAFPTTDYDQGGLYVEDQIVAGPLSLYPAVRWDYYRLSPHSDALYTAAVAGQSASRASPKLSAIWTLNTTVSLFANAAQGFKAPSPSQVNNGFANLVSNYRSVPNPGLKAETSETLEGGLRLKGGRWSASVTGFTGRYENFIEQVQTAGNFTATNPAIYQFTNLRDVTISGAEAKGAVALPHGFGLQGAFSYAAGASTSNGVKTPLASIEPIKVVAGVTWKDVAGRFGGQLTAVHSEGKALSQAGVTCSPACFVNPAFTTLDLTAYWNITAQASVRAGVFNLTDATYYWWSDVRGLSSTSTVIPGYSQPGRNYSVSIAYRF